MDEATYTWTGTTSSLQRGFPNSNHTLRGAFNDPHFSLLPFRFIFEPHTTPPPTLTHPHHTFLSSIVLSSFVLQSHLVIHCPLSLASRKYGCQSFKGVGYVLVVRLLLIEYQLMMIPWVTWRVGSSFLQGRFSETRR